jgi:hypothetical protein
MRRPNKVKLISGETVRSFTPVHAENILKYCAERKRHSWTLVENTGFIFEDNELKFKRNREVNKGGEEG